MMHVGQGLVCGDKIQDLIRAGFQFTIFLADYHSMINNKYGGDLQKIRTTGEYFQHCFTALGVPREKVEYVWASDLADSKEYWERVLRVARTVSTQRVLRAIPIMGRDMKSKDTDAAAIFYPCMQAADIFEMRLDVACAGLSQPTPRPVASRICRLPACTGRRSPLHPYPLISCRVPLSVLLSAPAESRRFGRLGGRAPSTPYCRPDLMPRRIRPSP